MSELVIARERTLEGKRVIEGMEAERITLRRADRSAEHLRLGSLNARFFRPHFLSLEVQR